jgi:hypothetical protein
MTLETRITDVWMSDLRQLGADFRTALWQAEHDEDDQQGKTYKAPVAPGADAKRKDRPDLKNKASRLLDLMISLGELERRRGGKPS